MKKILLTLSLMILLSGCTNEVEENKISYLEYKNELQEQEIFTKEENLDFISYFNIERENEEIINYSMTIDDISVDMYNVKALLIHDYVQDEVFPSVGILDEPIELRKDSDDKIVLEGTIQLAEDKSDINFKLYIEYTEENGNENKIYYQVSKG